MNVKRVLFGVFSCGVLWGALQVGAVASAADPQPPVKEPPVQEPTGQDWPTERANPQGTGAVAESLPAQLSEQWRYEAGEPIEATPVVVQGVVYVADVEGTVHAIDAQTGQRRWTSETEGGFLAPPAISGDTLVIGDYNGQVYALNVADGKQRWTFQTGGEINAGFAFFDGKVLIPSQDGNLYCLKTADGSKVWVYETTDQIQCSPTIAGSRTFLGGCDGQLHSVDLKTGKAVADPLPLEGPTLSTPAVMGKHAFLTTHGGLVKAFDWQANTALWQYADPQRNQEYRSSPAASDAAIVVSSQFRSVTALDPKTGEELWKKPLRRFAEASPVIAGEDVWIAATDGRLYRFALADGTLKSETEFRGSFLAPPAIVGQQLILANDDGVVIALGPAS
ncbi:outer membrane protein assembly factor BamB family protein [Roseimaritima sediminicola]|uniref:outer membrane protein assembly factor BamB family protein n=1 Tax=Roseimaritima sediminicola TaxID=2662066 RepID=UPI0012982863|nr:PQQ-binding-like beta-propeller repeat protein [Roseimaritima sediminicola]